MIKLTLFTFTLFFVGFAAPDTRWHQGVVVLNSGQVLTGPLQYHPKWEAVSLKGEAGIQTYHASGMSQFRFFDSDRSLWRKFHSFRPASETSNNMIYEEVVKGAFSLLRRYKQIAPVKEGENKYISHSSPEKEKLLMDHVVDFDFYFFHDGRMLPLNDFKEYAHELAENEVLMEFAELHHLDWRNKFDVVMMLNFLNCSAQQGCLPEFEMSEMVASN